MNTDFPRMIYGGSNEPQPDWRKEDPDQDLEDDDDPIPFSARLLREMFGFDPDDLNQPSAISQKESEAARTAAAKKARAKRHS